MQEAIGSATSTWLEQLVARMLYMYPGLRLHGELASLMEQCTQAQDALGVPLLDLTLQLLQVSTRPGASPPPCRQQGRERGIARAMRKLCP